MSDVRDELVELLTAHVAWEEACAIADDVRTKFKVTPKPEPISDDEELGLSVFVASAWVNLANKGVELRHELEKRGFEIVRKAETE